MARYLFAYVTFSSNVMGFTEVEASSEAGALIAGMDEISMPIDQNSSAEAAKAFAFDCDMVIGAHKID